MANTNLDPVAAQRTATLITLSLAMGVTLYAAVAWFLHEQGTAPRQTDPAFGNLLLYIWIGLTAVTSFAALFIWRGRVEPLIHGSEPLPASRMGELMSGHLIVLALVEGAALMGVTVYFLTGIMWPAIVSVFLIWFAVLATRPQVEWYQRFR